MIPLAAVKTGSKHRYKGDNLGLMQQPGKSWTQTTMSSSYHKEHKI